MYVIQGNMFLKTPLSHENAKKFGSPSVIKSLGNKTLKTIGFIKNSYHD